MWYRGAPSSLTNSGRSEALVWRPWINKPWAMTMRCAHICHQAALDPAPSPLPLSRVHRPTSIPSSLPLFSVILPWFIPSCFVFMSPQRFHPSSHSSMHAWLPACPGVLPVLHAGPRNCSATEASHPSGDAPLYLFIQERRLPFLSPQYAGTV